MDMRFYWLRDRIHQKQFHAHWEKGQLNKGNYPSKHHPTGHHVEVRPQYVLNSLILLKTTLQGCAKNRYFRKAVKDRYSSIAVNKPIQRTYPNANLANLSRFQQHTNKIVTCQ